MIDDWTSIDGFISFFKLSIEIIIIVVYPYHPIPIYKIKTVCYLVITCPIWVSGFADGIDDEPYLCRGEASGCFGEPDPLQRFHQSGLHRYPLHQLAAGGRRADVRAVELCQFAFAVHADVKGFHDYKLTTQIYHFPITLSTVYASLLRIIAHCGAASTGIVRHRVSGPCSCPIFVLSEENLTDASISLYISYYAREYKLLCSCI